MYWNGNDYDKMAQLVIDIYIDYNITAFPVDEKEICRKMGLKLLPYSAYTEKEQELLRKRSEDGFFSPATQIAPNAIYYDDSITSHGKIRYTIFHEVKHFANGDEDDKQYNDNMADYFARYFMAPIPYLIKMGIDDELTLISDHGISAEAAMYAIRNARRRKARYGDKIFDYEKPLIELLCPDL